MSIGLLLYDALWSGVAALGFAILFNVPVRTLPACALGGAAGHAVRTLLMQFGAGIEEATLAGATVVGVLGILFARIWKAPAPVFTIPGVIPMVPGSFAFRAMMGVIQIVRLRAGEDAIALLTNTAIIGIRTILILAALAIGIAIPSLIFRRHRPLL